MVGADGREAREDRGIERADYVVTTVNKQDRRRPDRCARGVRGGRRRLGGNLSRCRARRPQLGSRVQTESLRPCER